ncbi:MAG: hypothetical protein SGPRY_009076, partial [Prymnesium sp.]
MAGALSLSRLPQVILYPRSPDALLDSSTASSSEIVAGSLQDGCAARVIGASATYGKGIGQRVYGLSEGGALVLTIFKATTPAGREILGGIAPDEQRLLWSGLVGRAGLGFDLHSSTFKQPLCPSVEASLPVASPWRTQHAPMQATSLAPWIAVSWLSVGIVAAWLGSRDAES